MKMASQLAAVNGCYWKDVWKKLNIMRQSWQLCDITLISDGNVTFRAHSIILASGSSVFHAHLIEKSSTRLVNSDESTIRVCGLEADALQVTLDFIYGITPESIAGFKKLQKGADILGIQGAKVFCTQQILEFDELARDNGNHREVTLQKVENSVVATNERKCPVTPTSAGAPKKKEANIGKCPYFSNRGAEINYYVPLKKRFLMKVLTELKKDHIKEAPEHFPQETAALRDIERDNTRESCEKSTTSTPSVNNQADQSVEVIKMLSREEDKLQGLNSPVNRSFTTARPHNEKSDELNLGEDFINNAKDLIPHHIPDLGFGDLGVQCPHLKKMVGHVDMDIDFPDDILSSSEACTSDISDLPHEELESVNDRLSICKQTSSCSRNSVSSSGKNSIGVDRHIGSSIQSLDVTFPRELSMSYLPSNNSKVYQTLDHTVDMYDQFDPNLPFLRSSYANGIGLAPNTVLESQHLMSPNHCRSIPSPMQRDFSRNPHVIESSPSYPNSASNPCSSNLLSSFDQNLTRNLCRGIFDETNAMSEQGVDFVENAHNIRKDICIGSVGSNSSATSCLSPNIGTPSPTPSITSNGSPDTFDKGCARYSHGYGQSQSLPSNGFSSHPSGGGFVQHGPMLIINGNKLDVYNKRLQSSLHSSSQNHVQQPQYVQKSTHFQEQEIASKNKSQCPIAASQRKSEVGNCPFSTSTVDTNPPSNGTVYSSAATFNEDSASGKCPIAVFNGMINGNDNQMPNSRSIENQQQSAPQSESEEKQIERADQYSSEQNLSTMSNDELLLTLNQGIEDKKFQCLTESCEYSNRLVEYVQSHMHHRHGYGVPDMPCAFCDKAYFAESQLRTHVKQCHDKASTLRNGACVKTHRCDECEQVLKTAQALQTHQLKAHGKGRLFSCDDCDFKSPRKKDMQGHMISQHGKAPPGVRVFTCDQCQYKCIDKNRFNEHEASHSDEKNFQCPNCDKSYSTKRGLRNHLKYHNTERPHACDECGATFKVRAKLRDHIKLMHLNKGQKPYQCGHCQFRASVRGNVNQHIRNTHKGLPVLVIDTQEKQRRHVKDYDYAKLSGSQIEEVKDASASGYSKKK